MDFIRFYDTYWQDKGDKVDRQRLELLARHIAAGESVLQVDCGPGWLPEMLIGRGAQVIATDLSGVAVAKARARGVDARQFDIDAGPLPFADDQFDVVISDSQLEHRVDVAHALDEMARVLRPGGRLILLLPNTAHWRMRLWLLGGRFPYLDHTPTDPLHLRFFTLAEARRLLARRGLAIEVTDGSASLWVDELYPAWLRSGYPARLYVRLARRWPSLFARDFIAVARKLPLPPGAESGTPSRKAQDAGAGANPKSIGSAAADWPIGCVEAPCLVLQPHFISPRALSLEPKAPCGSKRQVGPPARPPFDKLKARLQQSAVVVLGLVKNPELPRSAPFRECFAKTGQSGKSRRTWDGGTRPNKIEARRAHHSHRTCRWVQVSFTIHHSEHRLLPSSFFLLPSKVSA